MKKLKRIPHHYIAFCALCTYWTAFVVVVGVFFMKNRTDNLNEYNYIHFWIKENYGSAKKCSFCSSKTAKRFEWALKKGYEYERNIDNFIELCPSCHRKYDFKPESALKAVKTARENPNNHWGKYLPNMKNVCGAAHPSAKAIIRIDKDGNRKRYGSITEAGYTGISNCLTNRAKTAHGFKWEYETHT